MLKDELNINENLNLLRNSKLIISNENKFKYFLNSTTYYKINSYIHPFLTNKKKFKKNTKDIDIINLYNFDHKLRAEILFCVGKIELFIRKIISDSATSELGQNWFLDNNNFENINSINNLRNKIARQEEKNIEELSSFDFFDNLTIGELLNISKNLKNQIIIEYIYSDIGAVSIQNFFNWLEVIRQIRNISAHHSRLWNAHLMIPRKIKKDIPEQFLPPMYKDSKRAYNRIYFSCLMINKIFINMNEEYSLKKNIRNIIIEHDIKDYLLKNAGFPYHWYNYEVWIV